MLPTNQATINREIEIQNVEDLIDEVDMNLRGPRRKLVVDEDKIKVKIVNKTKTRANWFAMQEERKAKERELALKQQ